MTIRTMPIVKHIALALTLLAPSVAARAAIQAPDRKPIASTPAPASKAAANKQETPRAILERAAFLEEHERDFEAAALLYKQSADAAQSAGDSKTADEALAARQRVLGRLGKQIEPLKINVVGTDDKAVIAKRIQQLVQTLSVSNPGDPQYDAALVDLVQFGAPVVAIVEPALSGMPGAGDSVNLGSSKAVYILAQLSAPEAAAALERGFQSPDPVLRRLIVQRLSVDRYRPLLEKAALDPVRSVREQAVRNLARLDDPALLGVMEPAARIGIDNAIKWMAKNAPEKLFDIAFAADASPDLKLLAASALGRTKQVPLDMRLARSMLELARTSTDDRVRRNMPSDLAELFKGPWKSAPPEIRMQVETEVLDHYAEYSFPQILTLLSQVGGIRTIQMLEINYWEKFQSLSDEDYSYVDACFKSTVEHLEPTDFDALADVFRAWRLPTETPKNKPPRHISVFNTLSSALGVLAYNGASVDSLVRGFEGLDLQQKFNYARAAAAWMKSAWDESAHAYRKGTVDPKMLPLVQYTLGLPDQVLSNNNYSVLQYAEVLGDQRVLPTLSYMRSWALDRGSLDFASRVTRTIDVLWERDPARGRQLMEEAVIDGLEHRSDPTRVTIGDVARLPAPANLEILKQLWPRATSREDKGAFVRALLAIQSPEATAFLLVHYPEIDSDKLRTEAIGRFATELYEPAIPTLGEALKSNDQALRKVARDGFKLFKEHREALEEYSAWTAADKDARASVADLSKLLESSNRDVVIGAVRALAAVKARSALPALVKLLDRNDPELKKAVEDAIAKIGG